MRIWQTSTTNGYDVFAIHKYDSIMIKEYCRKTFLMDKFDNSRIQKISTEIDPDQKMEVIMGSVLLRALQKIY